MAAVTLDAIRKVYPNGHIGVHDASLDIEAGEFIVLVGPSGCGKSTTLRMIAGLEEVTSGRLLINEELVNEVPSRDRNIAMVFQNYALYPHMNVRNNMAFGLKNRKQAPAIIAERVAEAAEILGLQSLLERKPKQLSGGQRQRVALGRAIVRRADVFLFDEPLSNLDAKMRVQTRTEIAKLHRRLGKTMIYVTHDQVEAMTLGDRIVVMEGGRIQQIDTPLALYKAPANRFVAGFVGSPGMNFLNGHIEQTSKLVFRPHNADFTIPIPSDWVGDLQAHGRRMVTLGIRPEHISLDDPEAGTFRARVDVLETMGNEAVIYADAGRDEPLVARIPPDPAPRPDTMVGLTLNPHHLHFFDAESGATLRTAG